MLGDSSERNKDSFRKPGIDAMMGFALLNASSNSGSNPGLTGNSACSVIMGPVSHSESSTSLCTNPLHEDAHGSGDQESLPLGGIPYPSSVAAGSCRASQSCGWARKDGGISSAPLTFSKNSGSMGTPARSTLI